MTQGKQSLTGVLRHHAAAPAAAKVDQQAQWLALQRAFWLLVIEQAMEQGCESVEAFLEHRGWRSEVVGQA